jgi:transcriptional regulator with XRE-family HTH domain
VGGADLAAALRRARLDAGWPSYRRLARQADVPLTTVWRICNGGTFPRWEDLTGILRALRISPAQIDSVWSKMWCQAEAQQYAPTVPGLHGTPAEERELPSFGSPHTAQAQAGAGECEDCGALIGNLVQHQAWHWRIERQLARANLRTIDGIGK